MEILAMEVLTISNRDLYTAADKPRDRVFKLVEKHGGKNGTPNLRQHVVGIFTDEAAMMAFRTETRAALRA